MRIFDYKDAPDKLLTPEMVQMLSRIHEYRGRQDLLIKSCEKELQSIDVKKPEDPEDPDLETDRNSEYDTLYSLISENFSIISTTPKDILQLHRKLYTSSGRSYGGHYRDSISDNSITNVSQSMSAANREKDKKWIRKRQPGFQVRAAQVEEYMNALCAEFNDAWEEARYDRLLLIPVFLIDFINIHAFDNGNEKMSRLMMHLLLCRAGYPVGRYIDLDRVIDKSIMTYYNVMESSSAKWNEGENDYSMFTAFFLNLLIKIYGRFEHLVHKTLDNRRETVRIQREKRLQAEKEQREQEPVYQQVRFEWVVNPAQSEESDVPIIKKVRKLSKPDQIRQIIDAATEPITKKDIMATCPDISKVTVERTLTDLVKKGYIRKVGAGPSTAYIKA